MTQHNASAMHQSVASRIPMGKSYATL